MNNAYVLSMSEEQLTATVIELAHFHGWMVAHFRPAKTQRGWRTLVQGDIGSPDLLLAKAGRVLLAELKAQRGRLSREQERWREAIGAEVYRLWKPSDLNQIKEVLGQ